jgi:uncharacterized membrane protein
MSHELGDLHIVGLKTDSRAAAEAVIDRIDEKVDTGEITVREIALLYRTKHGRTKVRYVHDHHAGIGAAIGAGWGLLGVGAAVGTGAVVLTGGLALIPIAAGAIVGIGVDAGIGALIGKAFDHHEAGKSFLKGFAEHVNAGGAAVLLVADPNNAEKLVAEARSEGLIGVETFEYSVADQERLGQAVQDASAAPAVV